MNELNTLKYCIRIFSLSKHEPRTFKDRLVTSNSKQHQKLVAGVNVILTEQSYKYLIDTNALLGYYLRSQIKQYQNKSGSYSQQHVSIKVYTNSKANDRIKQTLKR